MWFEVASGTGQGDIQGSPIFNVCLNWAAQLAEQHKTISKGMVLHQATEDLEEDVVMDTDYADEKAVLDGTKEGLQKSTDFLSHYAALYAGS